MKKLVNQLHFVIPPVIYLKNPLETALGRKIIKHSIELMQEGGLDGFTFKKLANQIGSNESSIYRYFENKHKLLLYLISYYWRWVEYNLVLETQSLTEPTAVLYKTIEVITGSPQDLPHHDTISIKKLQAIVVEEYAKAFQVREVDAENKAGNFRVYKELVERISTIIQTALPEYSFKKSLAHQLVQGTLKQQFLRKHFPNSIEGEDKNRVQDFFMDLFNDKVTLYGKK
ncbi:TetR/AcrR family transcriptional regulator [Mesonia sp. HuA40]|uniref:TetR/AcrR family transcriptional regulator n=1 Tax=Mesonia sp. HuA40 TaxID=2602761 RepID=UPI0011CC4F18|nr:TetR/AcrR family transcriptional regulator [Mesonia sp. HuA40]TXK71049.1 TetR/AcrR family transcriptional regulator [Mesonia sp. HuA40]